jgi:hypothetical protein
MSSVFGSVVTFIGAVFVLARIETSSDSTISAKNINLKSSSPGILMVGVGAALMISPNFAPQEIKTIDGNVYMRPSFVIEDAPENSDRAAAAYQEYIQNKKSEDTAVSSSEETQDDQ